MGKTVESYRMALEDEIRRWKGFVKALGKSTNEISRIMGKTCLLVNDKLYNLILTLKDDTVVQNAFASSVSSSSTSPIVKRERPKK